MQNVAGKLSNIPSTVTGVISMYSWYNPDTARVIMSADINIMFTGAFAVRPIACQIALQPCDELIRNSFVCLHPKAECVAHERCSVAYMLTKFACFAAIMAQPTWRWMRWGWNRIISTVQSNWWLNIVLWLFYFVLVRDWSRATDSKTG